jgi:hypothetical protein
MGGAVVTADDHAVEVVAHADGAIDAAVMTAAGEAVASGEVSALEVTAQGEGEARHSVALAWDAPRGVFHGAVKAGARLASGPLEVSCAIGGKVHKGRLDMAVVLPRPSFGGHMLALGRYSAEVVPSVGGDIAVHVRDAAGAAIAANAGLNLALQVRAKAGALHEVALRWNEPRACFEGRLDAAAELAGGAIELTASAGELHATGGLDAVAVIAPPSLGGSVVATGDYSVEIAPRANGEIEAVVHDRAGAAVQGGVELSARVQAGGELRPVVLAWDPASLRFRGKLEGDFKLEPGPIDVSIVAEGRLRAGSILAAVVLPAVDVDAHAGAKLKADAKLKAKADAALAAKLKAEAAAAEKASAQAKAKLAPIKGDASASAKLDVKLPKPTLQVKAGASAGADAKASAGAQTRAASSGSASGSAKQQGSAKLGGSLSLGGH